jgi:hypothetical protein
MRNWPSLPAASILPSKEFDFIRVMSLRHRFLLRPPRAKLETAPRFQGRP